MAFLFQRARIGVGYTILWFLDALPRKDINAVGRWEPISTDPRHSLRGVTLPDGSRPFFDCSAVDRRGRSHGDAQ